MSVSVDMFFAPRPRGGYTIYAIGRGGSVSVAGTHYPWFAVFAKAGTADSLARVLEQSFSEVAGTRVYDISELVPILPTFPFRADPVYSHQVVRVYTQRKEQVRPLAERIQRAFSVMAGVYNVTYEVRAAFDLDMKFFHEKTPILFAPNDELEALAEEVIGRVTGLKVMAFDIEVHTRPGRFPTPGDKLLSIQYGVARLDDPDFYSPGWARDNVVHLVSDRVSAGESRRLAEEFLRAIERERPDVIVGYNSVDFDAKYLEPFLPSPAKEELRRDRFHFKIGNLAFPHIDLMRMRKSMGSSLGIRSQRVMALDDVTREAARKVKQLSWLWGSGLMEAEERLDHTKLVSEWRKRSRLFYDYITADVYLTLILARLWLPTLFLLSALVQVPPTTLTLLNTGQVSEYNMIHFLERLGFEPYLAKRTREFKKAKEIPEAVKRLVPPEWAELYRRGKVYMKTYGLFEHIVEGDFAQLYPTIMANFSLDPTAIRATAELAIEETGRIRRIRDPVTLFGRRLYRDRRAYPALGVRPAKNADHMRITDVYEVVPTYGPVSFLLYKMYSMRKITKKIKKKAKESGRLELLAADQAVKILNNASYGAMSKRRGFINQVMASFIFWISLKILYDVIRYAEEELGLEVLYGDTDSVFIKCREDEARKLTGEEDTSNACSRWFEEHVLPKLNDYVRRRYGKEFTIEFEDKFGFCVYPKSKHEAAPSKKSYICGAKEGGRYRVTLFKGDFYKALAPQAIRERLDEFYEEVINREAISESEVEKILRRFLEEAPIPKLFVKKTVDELVKREEEQEAAEQGGMVVVRRLKKLNKTWHYAALHLAYVYGLPGVEELQKASTKNVTSVVYRVDADTVLDTGNIIPYFIPRAKPEEYLVYIEDNGELARVHSVVTRRVDTEAEQTGPKEKREKWYVVSEMFADRWLTKEELVEMATTYMRKYIIDDVVSKLAPAVVKSKAGPRGSLDAYIYGRGKKGEGEARA